MGPIGTTLLVLLGVVAFLFVLPPFVYILVRTASIAFFSGKKRVEEGREPRTHIKER